ncbi:RWD-domain-containing protein [Pluteus cervinus]|uniref:RWD-domain-containing protein n=1 Tax=Pluteus cervinus TaxID=181527 RepID=A0ACD3B2M1_9AGAR|nr:RWD-domain-containing protein [Pluteus cervinus]
MGQPQQPVETSYECQLLQAEEREVLKSIFPDDITFSDDLLHIEVPVELANPIQLEVTSELLPLLLAPELEDGSVPSKPEASSSTSCGQPKTDSETHRISVSALPPILLDVKLPPTYPLQSPPEILAIHVTHDWFPNISELQDLLLQSWVAGPDVVLFNWIETIHSGVFLEDLAQVNVDNTLRISTRDSYTLATTLSKYNDDTHLQEFLRATYACSICMDLFKGRRCIRLSCSHIFCRPCLTEFWVLSITEGNIDKVACVDPECLKKKDNRALPEEVKELVTTVLYHRWKELRLKRTAEIDPTATFCPRCEEPVWPGPEVQRPNGWKKYRCCTACSFSYCSTCLQTWHGIHIPCPIPSEILLEYISPTPTPERLVQLEEKYDKDQLKQAVKTYKRLLGPPKVKNPTKKQKHEVRMNEEWVAKSTMKCPGCQVPVWRDYGCNYMRCTRCGQHFCYQCGGPRSLLATVPHGPCEAP